MDGGECCDPGCFAIVGLGPPEGSTPSLAERNDVGREGIVSFQDASRVEKSSACNDGAGTEAFSQSIREIRPGWIHPIDQIDLLLP
jgi:hypothetical protein